MSKFKVGDKVAVYTWQGRGTGFVSRIGPAGHMDVKQPDGGLYNDVHPKQCRRLVKKQRRGIWMNINPFDLNCTIITNSYKDDSGFGTHIGEGKIKTTKQDGWLEFIEAPRKARKEKK